MKFNEKEFEVFRNFQKRLEKEFGDNTYVGTDYATVLVDYSPELKEMLRPLPQKKNFEFELKHLKCKCNKSALMLCLPDQITFMCDDCRNRARFKAVKAE